MGNIRAFALILLSPSQFVLQAAPVWIKLVVITLKHQLSVEFNTKFIWYQLNYYFLKTGTSNKNPMNLLFKHELMGTLKPYFVVNVGHWYTS